MAEKDDSKKQDLATVPGLLIVGFVFRLILLPFRFSVAFDEVNYLKLGVSGYLNGLSEVLHPYWSPLLPGFISFFCHFFSNFELAGRLVSVVAGAFLVIPIYFLGKEVFDKRVGFVAAGFFAVFPPLAFQSTQILTEPLYMLFAILAIYTGLRMLKDYSTGRALLAGICSGLAYLAHPQGVGFFLLLVLWIVAGSLFKLFLIRPLRIVWLMAALLAGFLVVSAPYLFYLKRTTGAWTFSTKAAANLQMEAPAVKGGDPFRSLDAENKSVPIDRIFHQGDFLRATDGWKKPVREVTLKPFVIKYIKNVSDVFASAIPQLFTTLPLLLFGVGLLGSSWQPQQGKVYLYLLSFIAFFWLALIPAFHITLRYFTPLWPVCTLWIGKGVLHIHDWLSTNLSLVKFSKRNKLNAALLSSLLIGCLFLIVSFLPETARVLARTSETKDVWAEPIEQKKAGLWLKEHRSGQKIIMSRNHAVDFYAGNYNITQSVTIPRNDIERVLEYAKYRHVNYIVVNERYKKSYPEISFLLETSEPVAGLKLIYEAIGPANLKTRIFEVL
ncbi:MAG: ArnT family glycosyltransferase [bacterium]